MDKLVGGDEGTQVFGGGMESSDCPEFEAFEVSEPLIHVKQLEVWRAGGKEGLIRQGLQRVLGPNFDLGKIGIKPPKPAKQIIGVEDFRIYPTEVHAVIGPSGSGKSTLVKGLHGVNGGLDHVGEIIFSDGELCREIISYAQKGVQAVREIRRMMPMMPQETATFSTHNVEANLKWVFQEYKHQFGLTDDQINEMLAEATDIAQITDTVAGRMSSSFEDFSGGQRRRANFVQILTLAMLSKAPVAIFDELLSPLDPPLRGKLGQVLLKMSREKGIASVSVMHNVEDIQYFADRVTFMDAVPLDPNQPDGVKVGRIVDNGVSTLDMYNSDATSEAMQQFLASAKRMHPVRRIHDASLN